MTPFFSKLLTGKLEAKNLGLYATYSNESDSPILYSLVPRYILYSLNLPV